MFNKILMATDFSPASDCLVQCAAEFKALGLQEIVLAHIVYVANTPGLEDMLEAEARPQLERQQKLLKDQGIKVTTELRFGVPARELDLLANEHGAAMILIGSRGRSLVKTLLGSVSFRLLQVARRPVFLSRISVLGEGDHCTLSVCRRSFEHILFATDFSDSAEHSFDVLQELAKAHQPKITLLHVLDDDYAQIHLSRNGMEHQQAIDERRLNEMKQRLEPTGCQVSTEWVLGKPGDEIVKRTEKGEISLVMMGNHGKGFLREALLGSVANTVARHASTPILYVPSGF
jgi:nucleotide-binding universal stress UspA family protein